MYEYILCVNMYKMLNLAGYIKRLLGVSKSHEGHIHVNINDRHESKELHEYGRKD